MLLEALGVQLALVLPRLQLPHALVARRGQRAREHSIANEVLHYPDERSADEGGDFGS